MLSSIWGTVHWFLNIPVNAIIDGATLYLTGTVTSNAPQFDPAYVEYQIKTFPNDKFESLGGEQWTAITNATLLETEQAPRSPNSFQDYSISLNQTALTYIKNSLSSGRLHLSFRATEEETFGTNRNIHLVDFKLNPNKSVSNSVRLVINWHLPGSISITADNNFTAPNGTHGVIQISGYGNQTAPFTFSKTEGESVSLTAISPQNDNQSHQVLWHTGSIRKSEWWRNGVPTGNDQTKTFTVTADDNGKTYQVQFTKNYAISRNDKTEFNGTIGAGVVTYIVEGNTDTVPAPGTKTVGSNVYTFAGFEDSDGNLCPNR